MFDVIVVRIVPIADAGSAYKASRVERVQVVPFSLFELPFRSRSVVTAAVNMSDEEKVAEGPENAEAVQNQETTNKGCVGPDSLYIKLISSDGHEFIIKRKNALLSGTIAAMLGSSGEFLETKTNEIHLRETHSFLLLWICLFMNFKTHHNHKNSRDVPNFPIPREICLELMIAADYLVL